MKTSPNQKPLTLHGSKSRDRREISIGCFRRWSSCLLLVGFLVVPTTSLWPSGPTLADGIQALNSEDGKADAASIFAAILENPANQSTSEAAQSMLAEAEYALGNKDRAFWLLGQLERSASSPQKRAAAVLRMAALQMDSGMEKEAMET